MNRMFLLIAVILSALMTASSAVSADVASITVLDSLGSKYPLPVTITVTARTAGVADSLLVFTRQYSTGQGEAAFTVPADFDSNGTVNFDDFFLFAPAFRQAGTGDNVRFDTDKDGQVGFLDFFFFANHFGQGWTGTSSTVRVSSPEAVFASRDTVLVGLPPKALTLRVRVVNLRQELVVSVAGDTSRLFVGDTLVVRDVRRLTFYGNRQVASDALSDFALTADLGLLTIGGGRLVAVRSGLFTVNIQSEGITTSLSVRVQPLRVVFFAGPESGRSTIMLGDTVAVSGGIDIYRDTVQVAGQGIQLDSLKLSSDLKTNGRLVVGDKVGVFRVNVSYDTLKTAFTLTVNPPPDKEPPVARATFNADSSVVSFTVSDNSKLAVRTVATLDGNAVFSDTTASSTIALKLTDGVHQLVLVFTDKSGNASRSEHRLEKPDRTPPEISLVDARWEDRKFKATLRLRDNLSGIRGYGVYVVNPTGGYLMDVSGPGGSRLNLEIPLEQDFPVVTEPTVRVLVARANDQAGNLNKDVKFSTTQPVSVPPPPPPSPPSFTTASLARGSQSFPSGSSLSATAGQTLNFSLSASGNPGPSITLAFSANNGVTWTNINGSSYTLLTTQAGRVVRFRAVAANGVPPDGVATWTVSVQGGAP